MSTECKLGLTCPEGKCQAKCVTDEDCTVIDPDYGCPAGQCEKVNPWKCAYFPNVPDLCVCQWKSEPAGEPAPSCSDECCGMGIENGITICQCFPIQPGDVPCDEQHAMYDPPMTKVVSCPPAE